ncbi:MAG: DUF4428 domain-containing protein, partial [Propionibacteriaceae bacterium]|nr:DUF4428 domain-containing protein [Propionibacteriaceae bacterium]
MFERICAVCGREAPAGQSRRLKDGLICQSCEKQCGDVPWNWADG